MDCLHHPENQITFICKAPHLCPTRRRLCVECQQQHGVDQNHTIPIKIFKDMVIKQAEQSNLQKTSYIKQQKLNFKKILSINFEVLKKIFEEFKESIITTLDLIEQENNRFIELIKQNTEQVQSSQTDLEKLIAFLDGDGLEHFSAEKNSSLRKLQQMENQLETQVNSFSEKIYQEILENVKSMKSTLIQYNQSEFHHLFQSKKNFSEILTLTQVFNTQLINNLISIMKKEKITDCISFFSNSISQQQIEQHFRQINLNPPSQLDIQHLNNILINIQNLDFNKKNLSLDQFEESRKTLIAQITQQDQDEKQVQFLKFLVHLTAVDSRYIQSGSNSLNLLVELRADLKEQSFENIRIKDTSLAGANLVRSNLSGSDFNNVDISGVNLNGALLFNCKWRNLKIPELDELKKFDGHTSAVISVCFSPDGSSLTSGSADGTICLWDVKTGKQKWKLNGHTSHVNSVCFSPDGSTLASGSGDQSISLWNVKTGKQKGKFLGHTNGVCSVSFSPDGSTLASGSKDSSIRLWDVKMGQQKGILDGHTETVCSVCFSPDGSTLASGSRDKSIRLWEVQTGQQKGKFDGCTGSVQFVCFSPDGSTIASSDDYCIRLWEQKTGKQKGKLDDHNGWIFSFCFSPDGSTLASHSGSSIRLWDVTTGLQKAKLDGHDDIVRSLCFSPDGTILASGSNDKSICLWDVKIAQTSKLDSRANFANFFCFSSDGSILASSSDKHFISHQSINTQQHEYKYQSHTGFWSICYSPDGSILAQGSNEQSISLWDVKSGKQIGKLNGHTGIKQSFGSTLTSVRDDKSIRLWDVNSCKEIISTDTCFHLQRQKFSSQELNYYQQHSATNIAMLRIAQSLKFQVQQALILKGEFQNYQGNDIFPLLLQKGGVTVESLFNKK